MDSNFKWFVPYFGCVSVYEFANLFNLLMINHTDSWCANIMELIDFILFTYLMTSLAKRASYKKKVYLFAGIVILFSFIDMFFVQGMWKLNTIAMVLQALFILTLIYNYYHDLLKEATEGLVLLKHPPFLVVTGLLFYFLSKSLFYSCYSYMVYKNNYHFYMLAATIPGLSNLLLNSILIYAFLCFSKTKKLSL
ncbi:hypothetical protein [Mucilaginibacter sp.]|uniref:hypothetical protein n=1 Tax=Mucilaginibacter sp. TaxID=1882438 RepID=UPI0025F6E8DF|nr:hypothetical protein [Mucilaginibacter sp.]